MMSTDMARAFDPVLLARDCGIEPDAVASGVAPPPAPSAA